MSVKKIVLGVLLSLGSLTIAAEETVKIDYMPEFHGAIRARYEADLDNDLSRFQVRNARLSLGGRIAPAISYFAQVDLCNQGKMQFLDAWGRLDFTQELYLQAGQFRMPFGVEPFFAPGNYLFSNRSFIGKQICNYRGTGVKFGYAFSRLPLTLEAGAFNSAAMEDHTVWSKHFSYAAKAEYRLSEFIFSVGYETIAPYAVRFNNVDFAMAWKSGRWWLQGEYMNKHYCSIPDLDGTHSWVLFADYSFPVRFAMFNGASVQGRYDGMTDNCNGKPDFDGRVTITDAAVNRITIGGTLTYAYKKVHADVRVNYEKHFYHSNTIYPKGFDNLLTAELVIKF
ncbi:MAG: OprO/OprP family phosphate-selective porin [Muribaculaceae bacterium]|nr:OprO/OprP family phosphate-selective porin [Muribaculaceae bacterium]